MALRIESGDLEVVWKVAPGSVALEVVWRAVWGWMECSLRSVERCFWRWSGEWFGGGFANRIWWFGRWFGIGLGMILRIESGDCLEGREVTPCDEGDDDTWLDSCVAGLDFE